MSTPSTNIPSHVPASLVRDFNFYDLRGAKDLFHWYKELHDGPDVFYTPHNGGHWVGTRHDVLEYIYMHPEQFSNRHNIIPPAPVTFTMVEFDGQKHMDFRKLLMPFFTPKAVSTLEGIARKLTVSLIDDFHARGECEFTADFALKMPIVIVTRILCELPDEDIEQLISIAGDLAHSGGDPMVQKSAFDRVYSYFGTKVIPPRREKPGNDLISAIIHGKVEGGRSLTDEEILGLCAVIIGGGLDTVASEVGFIIWFLARHPGHRRQLLDDPALIPNAIEEFLRRFAVTNLARTVAKDFELNGVCFKDGDMVLMPTTLAGLDDRRYPDPMTVDFHRADRKHLTFGRGPHQCIGSFVARTELKVFLTEWLQRIPHFEIKPGEDIRWAMGLTNRISYLPITWKA